MSAKRRIKSADVKFLSLVPKGANQMKTAYKADDTGTGAMDFGAVVVKSEKFAETGDLLAVAYAPNLVDSQGDFADTAEAIKSMAASFLTNGAKLDLRHNEIAIPASQAHVVESFIVQKGDARFANAKDYAGNAVDVTGAWAVALKIEDPELRRKYREGEFQGVSFGGQMRVEAVKEDAEGLLARLEKLIAPLAAKLCGPSPVPANKEDIPMTPEEIKALKDAAAKEAVDAHIAAEAKKTADKLAADTAAAKALADETAAKAAKEAADKKIADDAVAAYKAANPPPAAPSNADLTGDPVVMAAKAEDVTKAAKSAAAALNESRGLGK